MPYTQSLRLKLLLVSFFQHIGLGVHLPQEDTVFAAYQVSTRK